MHLDAVNKGRHTSQTVSRVGKKEAWDLSSCLPTCPRSRDRCSASASREISRERGLRCGNSRASPNVLSPSDRRE